MQAISNSISLKLTIWNQSTYWYNVITILTNYLELFVSCLLQRHANTPTLINPNLIWNIYYSEECFFKF